jgi:plastocyanin
VQTSAGSSERAQQLRAATATLAVVLTTSLVSATRGQVPQSGSIAGRVKLTARARGVALPTNAYPARAVSLPGPSATPEMRNVVVYLKNASYPGVLPTTRRQIRQEHESFVPRVVAITRGSTVDFPNGDPFFHNVFSLSGAGTFDLGRYPDGQSRSRVFTKAGLVKVYCHIHSQMSAAILVMDHPFFATPDDDGAFVLPDVPAGPYTLVAWHERVGEQTVRLVVQPGQSTTLEVKLPVAEGP